MYLLSMHKGWVLQLKETKQNSCIFLKASKVFSGIAAPSKWGAVENEPKPPPIQTSKALGCSKTSFDPISAMLGCEGLSTESSLVSADSRTPFSFSVYGSFQAEPQPYCSLSSPGIAFIAGCVYKNPGAPSQLPKPQIHQHKHMHPYYNILKPIQKGSRQAKR